MRKITEADVKPYFELRIKRDEIAADLSQKWGENIHPNRLNYILKGLKAKAEKKQKRQAKKAAPREQPKPEPQGPTAREIIQANPHVANQLRSVIPVVQEKAEIRQKREAELAEQQRRAQREAASQQDAAAREHEQRKREQQQRAEQAERELAERIERAHQLPDDATFKDYLITVRPRMRFAWDDEEDRPLMKTCISDAVGEPLCRMIDDGATLHKIRREFRVLRRQNRANKARMNTDGLCTSAT